MQEWRRVWVEHSLARVDEDDGEIGGGGAGRHVAGVLLVAGGVGDDELALGGGKVAVGDVDGDALLALGLQTVDEEGEVDVFAGGAVLRRIALQGGELVLEQELGVVEQPADQGRLAVVHGAAGEKAQKTLGLLLGQEVGQQIGQGGSRGHVVHQK